MEIGVLLLAYELIFSYSECVIIQVRGSSCENMWIAQFLGQHYILPRGFHPRV